MLLFFETQCRCTLWNTYWHVHVPAIVEWLMVCAGWSLLSVINQWVSSAWLSGITSVTVCSRALTLSLALWCHLARTRWNISTSSRLCRTMTVRYWFAWGVFISNVWLNASLHAFVSWRSCELACYRSVILDLLGSVTKPVDNNWVRVIS